MYAGLILQSLDIECEIFEASERVGGRIDTWYSTNYDANDKNKAGLYGEVGGMRIPQFSDDMLSVQHLALSLNAVLRRNKLEDYMVKWRKFYYNSDVQRMRYNNMPAPVEAKNASLNSFNFGKKQGGDLPEVWVTPVKDKDGKKYLPINKILDMVNGPFLNRIDKSFEKGFKYLMKFDNHSMWSYLTNVFKLEQLGDYYDPKMGKKSEHLSYNVTSYLETMNVGTGMYSVSFVEMVLATYDWLGSLNPYNKKDNDIYMVTVDKGMQSFPEACRMVLNLETGVLPDDGYRAQQLIGMIPGTNKKKGYSPDNLTSAAEAPKSVPKAYAIPPAEGSPSGRKERVFMNHRVSRFWAKLGNRQNAGLGVGTSDRSNRQIVYPSYGYDAKEGVLQIYCWAQDAERLGVLSDKERVNECLKGIQYLYPEVDVYKAFAGYDPEVTTKTWFWDNHANGGAFALFAPGQFKSLYPTLLTPEYNGCLNLAGECCSVHHGWIVGALDSAYNAVNNILHKAGAKEKLKQLERTWGSFNMQFLNY